MTGPIFIAYGCCTHDQLLSHGAVSRVKSSTFLIFTQTLNSLVPIKGTRKGKGEIPCVLFCTTFWLEVVEYHPKMVVGITLIGALHTNIYDWLNIIRLHWYNLF